MKHKDTKVDIVIQRIAKENNVSVDDVRGEIKGAIAAAMANPDPKIQEVWKQVPCAGEVPTPEELITWIAAHFQA